MRMTRWLSIVVAGVMGIGLLGGLHAEQRRGRPSGEQGGQARQRVRGFVKELDLSPEQKKELAELLRGRGDDAREMVEEIRERRDRLATAVTAEDPNPRIIRRAARALAEVLTDRAVRLHEDVPEFRRILTDAQQDKIAERREQREERVDSFLERAERIVDAIESRPELADRMRKGEVDADRFPMAGRLRERRQRRMERLGITEDQREELRQIMVSHAGEILEQIRELVDAHRDLRDEVLDDDASAGDVRRAGAGLGRALSNACVRLADLLTQVRPVLTEEQLDEAEEMREERREKRREMVDRWLEKLGSGSLVR